MRDHSTRPTRRRFFGIAGGTLASAATLSAVVVPDAPDILPLPTREPIDWQVITLPGFGLNGRDITITINRYAAPDARWAESTFPLTNHHVDGSVSSYRVVLGARSAGTVKGGAL